MNAAEVLPTNILIIVLAMILWALAFVRIAFGIRTIVDTQNGIHTPWVHAGWVLFAWAFLYVSIWPLIDVVLVEEWEFSDLLVMVVGGLLFFIAAAAISPDATYEDADGDSRYLEVAPVFFGFFAAYQAWLIVLDGTLVRSEELAPLQGAIVALWVAGVALAVLMAVALTMVQLINRHSGFRPYLTHTAWALWMFFWMILVWWRVPLLVTDGWNTTISCSSQPARSSCWGSYPSLARFLVWLLRHSPGNRLATAAPEDGEHGIVALTALGFNAQPVRAFDIDSGGAARKVLYLGGNADLQVLVDPCNNDEVEYVSVAATRLVVIDEVTCVVDDR